MNSIKALFALVLLAFAAAFFGCSRQGPLAAGSSSETVIGKITNADGSPAQHTRVTILPSGYNPETDWQRKNGVSDTTDASGEYLLRVPDTGRYTIQAVQLSLRTRLLISSIGVSKDSMQVAMGVLGVPGFIRVELPAETDTANGYVYIPGTSIMALIKGHGFSVTLDSVPSGVVPELWYGVVGRQSPQLLITTISVLPGDTAVTTDAGWRYSQKIFLNTTGSGAGVMGTVAHFPVLVRLATPAFDFSQAQGFGNDLRFAKADGSYCPYQIEQWDSAAGSAKIWVNVDTVYGNDNSHYVKMLWGNPSAPATSMGGRVFDTAQGFVAVWHLSEPTGAAALDATFNRFDGTASDTAPVSTQGILGGAKQFNGVSSFFDMKNTAAGKLSLPENGTYTVSAWAYADTLDNSFHVIVGKSDYQYFLKLKQYYPPNPMRWEFVEFHDKTGWQITDTLATAQTWCYLVGVRSGAAQRFYLNGALMDTVISLKADSSSRYTGDDVTIGKYLTYAKADGSYCPFRGTIDEVRISSVAQNADWIRLCYMNQKDPDALLMFK